MLEFQPITLSDQEWIAPLLAMSNRRGSEYTFSNNYVYRTIYQIEVARMENYYLVRSRKDGEPPFYLFPAGSGDLAPVIRAMQLDAQERGFPLLISGAVKEDVAQLETLLPGVFSFEEARDNFDYLYESESLITLAGKKLHSKRNFINRFKAEQEGNWRYEPIDARNIGDAWRMNVEWCAEMGCGEDPSLLEESCAVRNCFETFDALGLRGGLLRVGDRAVAFSMGRPLSSDTFIVHIEKAFASVAGAYPMINQQFAAHNCAEYRYVNREDDVGDEGLRKAKLSYRPAILLEKYLVSEKGAKQ